MRRAIVGVVLGLLVLGAAAPEDRPAAPRGGASRCLWDCHDCAAGARSSSAREACFRANAGCCYAFGLKPVLRGCGCW